MDLRNFGLSDDDLRQLGYKVGGAEGNQSEEAEPDRAAPGGAPVRRKASPALRVWLATLIALPVVAWASSTQRRLPDPQPATVPDESFSSARAMAQLVEVAQRPHPTGSPDLIRVRSTVLGRLSALGLEPDVQVTTSYVRDSSLVTAATVRNVVVRVPGSESTGAVAIVGHYDSAPLSPGAGDNALGVAAALEAVRAVRAGPELRNDLIVVFTDGDEVAALGARAFRQGPWAADAAVTISVESRGVSGPAFVFESVGGNGALLEGWAALDVGHTGTSLTRPLAPSTLESRLWGAPSDPDPEAPTVALTVLGGRSWEDQVRDVRERVDERSLQHAGEHLLGLVRTLGDLDLRRDLGSPGQTYFSLPVVGLVRYPRGWNALVSLGLLGLWALVGWTIRLRRGGRNGIVAGVALGLGAVGLSALAAGSLVGSVGGLHPEYGLVHTAFYRDAPHALALFALALAVTMALYGAARRWCRLDELLFGALALPLGYVFWLTFSTPEAAAAAQWPLALALGSTLLITLLGPRRGASVWAWGLVLTLSAGTLALVVPSLELVTQAWTLRRATEVGALFSLTTLLLLPLLDWLRRPKAWATPLLAVAVGSVLTALNLPSIRGAVDHPEPTTLVYLSDTEADTDPVLRGEREGTDPRTVLGTWLTVAGPGEEWARSWVGEAATGSTDPGVLLIGPDSRYEIAGTAPDAELSPPVVAVRSAELAGGRREVVLDVSSGLQGEMMGFVVVDASDVELTGVGDASWPAGSVPTRRLVHWGLPQDGALRVALSLPRDAQTAELVVLEHHLRPREILGDYFFQRADSIIPSASLGSDRAIQRTVVTIDVAGPVAPALDGERAPQGEEALETPGEPVRP